MVAQLPLADSISDAMRFIKANESWIVEACYSDIVEPLFQYAEISRDILRKHPTIYE